MSEFPSKLDGATVLWRAAVVPGQQGHDHKGEHVAISEYAIAQYAGDEPRVYLFALSADHVVIGDWQEESPDDAMHIAIDSGFVSEGAWKRHLTQFRQIERHG